IGKEGLNARLAARLTGWKVDIKSDSEFAEAEAKAAFGGDEEGEDYSGRCAAVLANGKRCPNSTLPGSKYCGVPAHQALADQPVPVAAATSDDDVAVMEAVVDEIEAAAGAAAGIVAAAAVLEEAVEEAVAAGEIDATDAAEITDAIEEATGDELAEPAGEPDRDA
ncbi:MAG: transcription termination/antitermination protein NusA, partial [Thermoleophilia bacterium]|nr:transcription termination/antitermination protein NusA [Thermoleophilia bacterium]